MCKSYWICICCKFATQSYKGLILKFSMTTWKEILHSFLHSTSFKTSSMKSFKCSFKRFFNQYSKKVRNVIFIWEHQMPKATSDKKSVCSKLSSEIIASNVNINNFSLNWRRKFLLASLWSLNAYLNNSKKRKIQFILNL